MSSTQSFVLKFYKVFFFIIKYMISLNFVCSCQKMSMIKKKMRKLELSFERLNNFFSFKKNPTNFFCVLWTVAKLDKGKNGWLFLNCLHGKPSNNFHGQAVWHAVPWIPLPLLVAPPRDVTLVQSTLEK